MLDVEELARPVRRFTSADDVRRADHRQESVEIGVVVVGRRPFEDLRVERRPARLLGAAKVRRRSWAQQPSSLGGPRAIFGSMKRRDFLTGLATIGAMPSLVFAQGRAQRSSGARPNEFVFARLRYDSGDWDYNPKVCANVLDTIVQYTSIPVHEQEVVITADSTALSDYPFVFMTGHKLVRFSERERKGLARFVENGGLLFSDDCNHDVNGLYARSFEAEMRRTFAGPDVLAKVPNRHPVYRAFFQFDGPPQTSHEVNGWGDNIVHDYIRGVERNGRLGVVYSNQDYGCEWDYSWRNKRFRARDNTKFAVNLVVYSMT
jgi:hypothetical protein